MLRLANSYLRAFRPLLLYQTIRYHALPDIQYALTTFSDVRMKKTVLLNRHHRAKYQTGKQFLHTISLCIEIPIRIFYLQALFAPVIIGGLLWLWPLHESPWYREHYFIAIRKTLEKAGPTFIKLGQWGATRPDIIPRDLCAALEHLHSNAPQHSFSFTESSIKRNLGKSIGELFEDFETVPIGSGTIGQVYKAKMKDTGILVAVKVRHPRIVERVALDLGLISAAARFFHSSIPALGWLGLPNEVSFFAHMMNAQLDFRQEAASMRRFCYNFRRQVRAIPPVIFSSPVYPWVTEAVLVETLMAGYPIKDFMQLASHDIPELLMPTWKKVKDKIALSGLRAFLKMLLWDNFIHADLHPGNILVQFVDVHTQRPVNCSILEGIQAIQNREATQQLIFLDTGLTTELSPLDFEKFADFFATIVLFGDGWEAGRMMIERATGSSWATVIDPEGFCYEMQRIIDPLFSQLAPLRLSRQGHAVPREKQPKKHRLLPPPVRLAELSLSPLLYAAFEAARNHHVRLEPAFTNVVMSMICVEGIGTRLSPHLDLLPTLVQSGGKYLVATEVARRISQTTRFAYRDRGK